MCIHMLGSLSFQAAKITQAPDPTALQIQPLPACPQVDDDALLGHHHLKVQLFSAAVWSSAVISWPSMLEQLLLAVG